MLDFIKIITGALVLLIVIIVLVVGLVWGTMSDRLEVTPRCTLKPMWEIRDYSTFLGRYGVYEVQYVPMSYSDEYERCILHEDDPVLR